MDLPTSIAPQLHIQWKGYSLSLEAWNHWTTELFYHFPQRSLNQEAVHIVERIQTGNTKSPWFDCVPFYCLTV